MLHAKSIETDVKLYNVIKKCKNNKIILAFLYVKKL